MVEEVVVRTKEVFYRGGNLEDLKQLDVREFAKYLPSRQRRTVLRQFQSVENFVRRCETSVSQKKKRRTHLRDMIVVPRLVGMAISVYNGKTFNEVRITPNMVGHRLGEFSVTRSRVVHGNPGLGATKSSSGEKK